MADWNTYRIRKTEDVPKQPHWQTLHFNKDASGTMTLMVYAHVEQQSWRDQLCELFMDKPRRTDVVASYIGAVAKVKSQVVIDLATGDVNVIAQRAKDWMEAQDSNDNEQTAQAFRDLVSADPALAIAVKQTFPLFEP
jgi:hypothetical protein